MTSDDEIGDEKLQHDFKREAVKTSALSLGKFDQCECLTGGETLPSDQRRIIEQDKFTYSPLGKTLKKETKAIEDQVKKIKTLDDYGKH